MFPRIEGRTASAVRMGMCLAAAVLATMIVWALPTPQPATAQDASSDVAGPSGEPAPIATEGEAAPATPAAPRGNSINLWSLTLAGGIFMIPIFGMSVLAVTMTIERFLGLRKERVLPDGLVAGLGQL